MDASTAIYQGWFLLHDRYESQPSDDWYIELGGQLMPSILESELFNQSEWDVLGFISAFFSIYLEDLVTGNGGWCRFIDCHETLYNKPLPFYQVSKNYTKGKINFEDLLFLTWSLISGSGENNLIQIIDPLDEPIILFAEKIFDVLQTHYAQAPQGKGDSIDWVADLRYFSPDYRYKANIPLGVGTSYFKLINDGYPIMYVASFGELNRLVSSEPNFFDTIDYRALSEKTSQELAEELTQEESSEIAEELVKYQNDTNFVVFSFNTQLLVAVNIAPYFKDKRNKLYNEELAINEGYTLFLTPEKCPLPILRYAMEHQLLSDAALPIPNGKQVLQENWDFIARWFLKEDYPYIE